MDVDYVGILVVWAGKGEGGGFGLTDVAQVLQSLDVEGSNTSISEPSS
jgi:hypothetical protein